MEQCSRDLLLLFLSFRTLDNFIKVRDGDPAELYNFIDQSRPQMTLKARIRKQPITHRRAIGRICEGVVDP